VFERAVVACAAVDAGYAVAEVQCAVGAGAVWAPSWVVHGLAAASAWCAVDEGGEVGSAGGLVVVA